MTARELEAQRLQKEWNENPRWKGIKRGYTAEEVVRSARYSLQIDHSIAKPRCRKTLEIPDQRKTIRQCTRCT